MPFVSPAEIVTKAKRAYPRFLDKWICSEDSGLFPLRIPANLKPDRENPQVTIAANENLLSKSKERRGWGYTVHRQRVASLDFGNNYFPKAITIDTLEDLLRLAGMSEDFRSAGEVAEKIRHRLPQLEQWLRRSVRSLANKSESCDRLILVVEFFTKNPWPDCYARQIPVNVDTKFILRNSKILRQWLDILLPDSAIDVNEKQFARRFGLRDGEPHRGIRLLDPQLSKEVGLPYGELSLPLRSMAEMTVSDSTVFIVENDMNLLTMPHFPRGIGIRGEGNAVNRLERVKWLGSNRLMYWGDIDTAGFIILSRLRNLFPHVESILMNLDTLKAHRPFVGAASNISLPAPTNLTEQESAACKHCLRTNERLEQEKILQPYVDKVFGKLI